MVYDDYDNFSVVAIYFIHRGLNRSLGWNASAPSSTSPCSGLVSVSSTMSMLHIEIVSRCTTSLLLSSVSPALDSGFLTPEALKIRSSTQHDYIIMTGIEKDTQEYEVHIEFIPDDKVTLDRDHEQRQIQYLDYLKQRDWFMQQPIFITKEVLL